jgi:FAD/FMN-containing dehydrogenase/Fe-S oxidoreductase
MTGHLQRLHADLEGELYFDNMMRICYATDASVYKEWPLAVAVPRTKEDIQKILHFAWKHETSIIPRAGGTSLAGQCVGGGIVVDISKYFNHILEVDAEAGWVRLQPGIIRDELNERLRPHGLFFGPNTSTANRAMIGGMVGNNSCGTTSIVYGSTRDHVLELEAVLSDGSEATFRELTPEEYEAKLQLDNLEGKLYKQIDESLRKPAVQQRIREHFPKPGIHRRNTGYAVDQLLALQPFQPEGPPFNFCKLLCGSEGTLAFVTEIKLHVDPLPAPEDVVVCAHFSSIDEAMHATLVTMQHEPAACELMDKIILDLTKDNIEQQKNRFFVEGDPAAILMIEFRGENREEAEAKAGRLIAALQEGGHGYAYPKVFGPATQRVWKLRAAGLGLMSNMPGDAKPVACIEDTAVAIEDLPSYIAEFSEMMKGFGQEAVYYAHAGAGELHLRPILNLKAAKDQQLFYDISEASARLVKKYKGSLSGEHGDGRARAAFIPMMIGAENYELLRDIKGTWDPLNLLNPGKIVDAPPMNESLRYAPDQETPEYDTAFDYSAVGGVLRLAEKCNGSGDCRKLAFTGGTMCPSYMVTRDEWDSTRARANVLRELLTRREGGNPFNHPALDKVMDLCLSCKGCTSECPSNVDVATLKAEYLYQKYRKKKPPLRSRVFANIGRLNKQAMIWPALSNFFLSNKTTSSLAKKVLGVARERSLPLVNPTTLRRWYRKYGRKLEPAPPVKGKVWFFCDEFTNYNDTEIGIQAIRLLNHLGYEVGMLDHPDSGRGHISKGLLEEARKMAMENVRIFSRKASEYVPIVGVEPSAILGFRDEYPRLVPVDQQAAAKELSRGALMIEEFLSREIELGKLDSSYFTKESCTVLLHGHCHQKALSSVDHSAFALGLPENYTVEVIPSGCCGMAGSFGYEKEHYELSMKIGELVLFPAVRNAAEEVIIAAPGTSCRHQILDGTGREAKHPVEVLWEARRNEK